MVRLVPAGQRKSLNKGSITLKHHAYIVAGRGHRRVKVSYRTRITQESSRAAGARTASPVAQTVIVTVLSLPPRRSVIPRLSVYCDMHFKPESAYKK